MLGHYNLKLPYHLADFFDWFYSAVDLFFCLSGFTLSYVYAATDFRFSQYLVARVARIYPLYIVSLIVVGAAYTLPAQIVPATYPAVAAFSDFVRQVLMVNSWPIIGTGVHWNTQSWSVSIESLCYVVVFPILLRLRPPASENARLLLLVVLSAACFAAQISFYDPATNTVPHDANVWRTWGETIRGISAFSMGWIAFWSYEQRDQIHSFCTRFSTALWLCFAAALTLSYLGIVRSHTVTFLFPFIVLAATDPCSRSSRLLESSPAHYIGVISYSIYMVHFISYLAFFYLFGRPVTWTAPVQVALIGTTFAFSSLTYSFLERPARDALRGCRIVSRSKGQMKPG